MAEQQLSISQGLDIPNDNIENMSNAVNDGSTKDKSIEIKDDNDEAPGMTSHIDAPVLLSSAADGSYSESAPHGPRDQTSEYSNKRLSVEEAL